MALLLDTGVLYALADADDAWHLRCRDFLAANQELLLVPVTVLPEVTYLLHERLGREAERLFVKSLCAGEFSVEPLQAGDLDRSLELLSVYPAIGFVGATVAALGERLRLPSLVTTDRRHFSALRPAHRPAFELLP